MADFQHSFTVRCSTEFVNQWSLDIPPQLKCEATLPCETFYVRNMCDWTVHARF